MRWTTPWRAGARSWRTWPPPTNAPAGTRARCATATSPRRRPCTGTCAATRGAAGAAWSRPRPYPGDLALAADGKRYRYVCDRCKAPFETRQALGGHRASHSTKKGCSWHAKQLAMAKPPKNDFDLNHLSLEAIQAAAQEEQAAQEGNKDEEPKN